MDDSLVRRRDVEAAILADSVGRYCPPEPVDPYSWALSFVRDVPAVDAVEVRHAKWVASSTEHTFSDGTKARWNIWKCSRCPYVRTAGWEYTREGQKPKARYCENCGARMYGRREDGDA